MGINWSRIYVYDIETYPNFFSCVIQRASDGHRWIFEVSERVNQSPELADLLWKMSHAACRMLGFNNLHFDYPVLHDMYLGVIAKNHVTAEEIYRKASAIFESSRDDWSHVVWESDHIVPQIDMFKIMHFDNVARSTSLKKLEIAMRSHIVEDLPIKPGTFIERSDIPVLLEYNCRDVNETAKFAKKQERQIEFRDELTEKYGRNVTNFNDTKIGKQHFIDQLEARGVQCYERVSGRRMPRQTTRDSGIRVNDNLLHVDFQTEELRRMWEFFSSSVIPSHETKGFFKDVTATLNGFTFHFGAGGIHGSVNRRSFYSTEEYQIIDVDVTSYYPSLAIVNRFYPEHLTDAFCDIYEKLKAERVGYAKGSAENKMLKLALNGVYGDSNNIWSPFYDPAYTMTITINGQLLLAKLAEIVLMTEAFELIQVNTDGLTIRLPRSKKSELDAICNIWSSETGLDLEYTEYRSMHVRDVNNYIAIDVSGSVKRKNAYLTEPDWHQNHSSLVVPKAVDAFVRQGVNPVDFIFNHGDAFDFMRHVKVPRNSHLVWGEDRVQNTSRYYIALTGRPLTKIMPPLAGYTAERSIAIDKGWMTSMCNNALHFDWSNLNRRWYVIEAEKLIQGLGLRVPVSS